MQDRKAHATAGERRYAVQGTTTQRDARWGARIRSAALVLLLGLGAVLPAAAAVRDIAPGADPALAPGEGLLLVEADSDTDLNWLQLVRLGGDDFDALEDTKAGVQARLIAVPAGRYAWRAVGPRSGKRYTFGSEDTESFDVAPGKITYPGDMVLRVKDGGVVFEKANRALRAIDWLEAAHPDIARSMPVVYSGHYPDPFPAFYARERAAFPTTGADLSATAAPPDAGHLPLSPLDLWHYRRIDSASLNPAGDLVVEAVHENDTLWAVDVVDLRTHTRTRLSSGPTRVVALDWSGDRTLLASVGEDPRHARVSLFDIRTSDAGAPTFATERLPAEGRVLATDYGVADQILYERRGAFGRLEVVALDIGRRDGVRPFDAALRGRLDVGADPDVGWFADGHGRVRAAMLHQDDGTRALMYGEGTRFDAVLPLRDDAGFRPLGLSDEGDLVFGLSDDGGQRDLVAFDPKQGKVVRTLFAKPGVDVLDAVLDAHGQPIGASYYENGQRVNTFFGADAPTLQAALARAFPERSVQVAGRSRDGGVLLVWVEASDMPPTLYRYDVVGARAERVDVAAPWLDGHTFVPSIALQATSRDGLPVEAYLTLPARDGRHALVVLPHGGPIGVSDRRTFNPEVQFLASLGYAVLQVNFRGSDGYGTAFREAGYHAAGGAIEDDIDAALQVALAQYPLDAARMCIMGSSYGGYSALESAIRWPDRYRCAVSIAGITDRMLFFTASDSGTSATTRAELERLVGDPNTEYDAMLATSPLYRYRALTVPVMLVHGREDQRVDYEHARRLVRMLNLAGNKPVMLSFDKEGHNWRDLNDIAKAYRGVAGFLQQHLGTPAPSGPLAAEPQGGGVRMAR